MRGGIGSRVAFRRLERSIRICCKTEKSLPIGDTSCDLEKKGFRSDSTARCIMIDQCSQSGRRPPIRVGSFCILLKNEALCLELADQFLTLS